MTDQKAILVNEPELSMEELTDSKVICEYIDDENISIELAKTYTHTIEEFSFDNLPKSVIIETYKDGRAFSHFIEPWLAINYPLIHIKGCKKHDHVDMNDENIKYDQKTFTKREDKKIYIF